MRTTLNRLGRTRTPCLFILPYDNPDAQGLCWPLSALPAGVKAQIGPYRLGTQPAPIAPPPALLPTAGHPDHYSRAFEALQREISAGNSYLANLCAPTPLESRDDLDQLYAWSKSPFKLLLENRFVCFSPEPFITIRAGRISAYPMKGTLPASQDPQRLLANPKERAEHTMVVDLLRNDLSQIATGVRVKAWRTLSKAGDLWQSSSTITGHLRRNWADRLGDQLFRLLPAGSISGAPKRSTVEILRRIEGFERGFFTGIFGLFDGRDLYSGVLIRFIEKHPSGLVFKSGGGITADSRCIEELEELRAKVALPLKRVGKPRGLLETIRVEKGRIYGASWHRRRMRSAAMRLGLPPPKLPALRPPFNLPAQGRFKLRLRYGTSEPSVYELLPAAKQSAKTLRPVESLVRYPLKLADRTLFQTLYKKRQNADDVLIIRRGHICDTTVANVAFFDGERWLTPVAPLLKGTLRARLLEGGFLKPASLRMEQLKGEWLVGLMNAITGFYIAGKVKDVLIND